MIRNYAGFWDRMSNSSAPLKSLFNITIIDKNQNPISLLRRLLRFILAYIPFIIYLGYTVFAYRHGSGAISNAFGYTDASTVSEISPFFYSWLIAQVFLYPVPFIVSIYIIDWIPFFIKKYNRPLHDIWSGSYVVYSDKKKFSLFRTILKFPFSVLSKLSVCLTLLMALWVAYNIPDRSLNPEVEEFFYENEYSLENNVRIAWAGLHAPSGTKDIYEYGMNIHKGEVDNVKHLGFKGEIDSKYYPKNGVIEQAPESYIIGLYMDNKELIDRYITLYKYNNYGDFNTIKGIYFASDLISIHQLLPLYWEYMAKNQQGSEAIEWWLQDMVFIQEMMGARSGFVEKSIWMVNYSINLNSLVSILRSDTDIINTYKDQIIEILNKNFMVDIWDVEDSWRAEYNIFRTMHLSEFPPNTLVIKPNDTQNKFLELAEDMIWLSKQPYKNIESEFKQIEEKHDCSRKAACYSYNIGKALFFGGFLKGWEMYKNGHIITARQRAIILWIEAKSRGLTSKEMTGFLDKSPEDLYNPLFQKPFYWDASSDSIYFLRDESDPETRWEIKY